jgi:hypothetical protein
VNFYALVYEVVVKLFLVLVRTPSCGMDLAVDKVVVFDELDEVADLVRWEAFQVDLVAIF